MTELDVLEQEFRQAGEVARTQWRRDGVSNPTLQAADANETFLWQTFRAGRGWNEGVNILIEYRSVEGNVARLPEVAADLVRLKPDLIATLGSLFRRAMKAATSSIQIVFVAHVGTGHVASLARRGGNITGMAVLQTD
jgi:putative ABC transport system substrate-binding protein